MDSIRILEGPFSQSDWNAAVSPFSDLSLLQTWEYGEASSRTRGLGVSRLLFEMDGNVVGAAQGFVRKIPLLKAGAVVINRGPLWQCPSADTSRLVKILRALRDHYAVRQGMYLRIAPAILSDGTRLSVFSDAGYQPSQLSRPWISTRLELSKPVEVLRRSLRQNWNASLKKAEAAGIVVKCGPEESLFSELRTEFAKLVSQKQFHSTVTPEFIDKFQEIADGDHKLWSLTATHGSRPLGGIALARYGSVCEYLIGAVNEEGKRLNAGQLLLWSALRNAKDRGYQWFDLGGMDPEGTPEGILYFKGGLQAEPYKYIGDFEAYIPGLINEAIRWRLERALR